MFTALLFSYLYLLILINPLPKLLFKNLPQWWLFDTPKDFPCFHSALYIQIHKYYPLWKIWILSYDFLLLSSCSLFILLDTWNLNFNLCEINISSIYFYNYLVLFCSLFCIYPLKKIQLLKSTFLISGI